MFVDHCNCGAHVLTPLQSMTGDDGTGTFFFQPAHCKPLLCAHIINVLQKIKKNLHKHILVPFPHQMARPAVRCFIASHIDCDKRPSLLRHAIDAAFAAGVENVHVSLSVNHDAHWTLVDRALGGVLSLPSVHVLYNSVQLSQFQHLYALVKDAQSRGLELAQDTIVFCDDDDLLLKCPQVTSAGFARSIAYVPTSSTKYAAASRADMLSAPRDDFTIGRDFAGYACPGWFLIEFLQEHADILELPVLDTMFVVAVDVAIEATSVTTATVAELENTVATLVQNPFVFYRKWDNPCTWRRSLPL